MLDIVSRGVCVPAGNIQPCREPVLLRGEDAAVDDGPTEAYPGSPARAALACLSVLLVHATA